MGPSMQMFGKLKRPNNHSKKHTKLLPKSENQVVSRSIRQKETKMTKHVIKSKIFEEAQTLEEVSTADLSLTNVVDYGTSLNDLMEGKVTPPPQGARIDVSFEGRMEGILSGFMKGIDYGNVRADGRFELNIHAEILTDDGVRIAYEAKGASITQEDGSVKVRESAKLTTSDPKYAWVNELNLIAVGTLDGAAGSVKLSLLR